MSIYNDTDRAPATEEKVTDLEQYRGRKELSPDYDDWYFGNDEDDEQPRRVGQWQ